MLDPVGKFATKRIKAWLEDYATLVGSVDFFWRSGSLTIPELVLKVGAATSPPHCNAPTARRGPDR